MPKFDRIAQQMSESLAWDNTAGYESRIDELRVDLAEAIRKRDEYAAWRAEQGALLEQLGYAHRSATGELIITSPQHA